MNNTKKKTNKVTKPVITEQFTPLELVILKKHFHILARIANIKDATTVKEEVISYTDQNKEFISATLFRLEELTNG